MGADLTDAASVQALFERAVAELGPVDLLVLNASGGMESGMGEDYAMRLNRDAQVNVVENALPHLAEHARIVFVTSHQGFNTQISLQEASRQAVDKVLAFFAESQPDQRAA